MNVKSAFLNGFLNEKIYVEQLYDFEKKNAANKVYLLKNTLYGLKQALKGWYNRLHSHLLSSGFERSMNEVTLYVKHIGKNKLIVLVYIDDLLITCDKEQLVEEFKASINDKFEINELGLIIYFLDMEVSLSLYIIIFLCQKRFSLKLLNKFDIKKLQTR